MDDFRIASGELAVTIKADGAEMTSLTHVRFGELLWQAESIWPQHAPNLFPIVGQLAGDTLHSGGSDYKLTRHGFARRRRFAWTEQHVERCALELRDDAQTLALFPFAFRLRIEYALAADALSVTYRIENPGAGVLPASIGAHPAFRWPLAASVPKAAHALEFETPEPAPIRRLDEGLLKVESFPSPVAGRTLQLDESLFAADAIVMDQVASRSVRYAAPAAAGTPVVEVSWERFAELGLWSKAGADFLCIEPWYGFASPVGFDGPFETKPGLLHIAAGQAEELRLRVRIL